MKKILLALSICLLAVPAVAGDGPWFDMANCGMCKHMAAEPEFIQRVGWDTHVLNNGLMHVTVVPEDYREEFDAVSANMEKTGMELMGGADVALCNHCSSMMGLMGTGKVAHQEVETIGGIVTLMTSDDPETVAALQKHAKKTIKAMEEFMAESAM